MQGRKIRKKGLVMSGAKTTAGRTSTPVARRHDPVPGLDPDPCPRQWSENARVPGPGHRCCLKRETSDAAPKHHQSLDLRLPTGVRSPSCGARSANATSGRRTVVHHVDPVAVRTGTDPRYPKRWKRWQNQRMPSLLPPGQPSASRSRFPNGTKWSAGRDPSLTRDQRQMGDGGRKCAPQIVAIVGQSRGRGPDLGPVGYGVGLGHSQLTAE